MIIIDMKKNHSLHINHKNHSSDNLIDIVLIKPPSLLLYRNKGGLWSWRDLNPRPDKAIVSLLPIYFFLIVGWRPVKNILTYILIFCSCLILFKKPKQSQPDFAIFRSSLSICKESWWLLFSVLLNSIFLMLINTSPLRRGGLL